MRTLTCFVMMPSGENPPLRLAPDEKHGWCVVPSSCATRHEKEVSIDFQDVYELIIVEAIQKVSESEGVRIHCTRGEDLPSGGNIISRFLPLICRADITITDLTGLNPNVLFEFGIRLSVKDSLNLLLCHDGLKIPQDIINEGWIKYSLGAGGAKQAKEKIVGAIQSELRSRPQEYPEGVRNLYRHVVELANGRQLERDLAAAFQPAPTLVTDLLNELHRLDQRGKVLGDPELRVDPKLRYRTWKFIEKLGETLEKDPSGPDRAIELYRRVTTLEGFRDKHAEIFYKLNQVCAADPNREAEAQAYLDKAKELDR